MVVTPFFPELRGTGERSPDPLGGKVSPDIPWENAGSQEPHFDFDPSETVIVVRRKKEPTVKENGVVLKSLLNNSRSLLTNTHIHVNSATNHSDGVKNGRIEKIKFVKR